jgi:tRNA-Thr(GGU) m(6)t(6)A37 methyltransferase TsaA
MAAFRRGEWVVGIELTPIGLVRVEAEEVPRNWRRSELEGMLVIDDEYSEGLADIEPGQRIVVIFNFHRSPEFSAELLRQTPPHTGRQTGIFSICSPVRPNPVGMSVLEVLEVEGGTVRVRGLDMLDGTPILDIKPYIADRILVPDSHR